MEQVVPAKSVVLLHLCLPLSIFCSENDRTLVGDRIETYRNMEFHGAKMCQIPIFPIRSEVVESIVDIVVAWGLGYGNCNCLLVVASWLLH